MGWKDGPFEGPSPGLRCQLDSIAILGDVSNANIPRGPSTECNRGLIHPVTVVYTSSDLHSMPKGKRVTHPSRPAPVHLHAPCFSHCVALPVLIDTAIPLRVGTIPPLLPLRSPFDPAHRIAWLTGDTAGDALTTDHRLRGRVLARYASVPPRDPL